MILHFQKDINVIIYIIELKKIYSFYLDKIWIKYEFFKVYVMFKMKYLINKIQCNTLSQQAWWFDGRYVCGQR
jgi:hypothetical protein